jgi:hypothetical protein
MSDLMNSLYGPLPVKYCMYFYILSIISFLTFLFFLGMLVLKVLRKKTDRLDMLFQLNLLVSIFIGYFTNRLMYSICSNSLK